MEDYKKKYEEALFAMRHRIEAGLIEECYAEAIFPELKESDGERIRKVLVEMVGDTPKDVCKDIYKVDKELVLAWLEKQKGTKGNDREIPNSEQNPADNAEPKFEIGDLITNGILVGIIDEIHELGYHAYFGDHYADVPDVENWHKWTIQDAKDGDVLAAYECLVLFKEIDGLNIRCYCTYHFMNNPSFYVETLQNKEAFLPATKEQRDLLFQKMKEAGYEWDAVKKELKKIEQKPAWSEEDENALGDALWCCKQAASIAKDENDMGNVWYAKSWLKSIKERYTWKPSESHIFALESVIDSHPFANPRTKESLQDLVKQLKAL